MDADKKTETEQLYDEIVEEVEKEDVVDETESDEITSEEELEDERQREQEIAEYTELIESLDEKLASFRADKITAMKRQALKEVHYTDEQVERYLTHIEGETTAEIKDSVFELKLDIPPKKHYIDQTPMGGGSGRPRGDSNERIKRRGVETIKRLIKERKFFL